MLRRRVALGLFVVSTASVAAVVMAGVRFAARYRIEQPIAFQHQLHIDEVGLGCLDCHEYTHRGARATIPNIDVCGLCHEEQVGESPEETRVVGYVADGVPIPWQKVYTLPEHVLFSHRRHVAIAGIPCEECHGMMAERTKPVTEAAVVLTMDACTGCHEEKGASNDCILCHR